MNHASGVGRSCDPQDPRRVAHFDARQQHPVERDKHGDLHQDRQAAAERIDFLGLVQLHHRDVHLLLVVAVLFAQFHQPRRDFLHLGHRLVARRRQRIEHRLDQHRQQHDRPTPVADDAVQKREQQVNRLCQHRQPAVVDDQVKARRDFLQRFLILRAHVQASTATSSLHSAPAPATQTMLPIEYRFLSTVRA